MAGFLAALGAVLWRIGLHLVPHILVGLGISFLTFTGVSLLVSQVIEIAQTHYAGMPANVLAIVSLGGAGDVMGIYLGALVGRTALTGLTKHLWIPARS